MPVGSDEIGQLVDSIYRRDSRKVFATLARLLKEFDLAEAALHEAFASALQTWQVEGVPSNPFAWLVSTGRFRAVDSLRRKGRLMLELLPDPEVIELLALMLLQESRRSARATSDGDLILLEDQDRRLWNHEQISKGLALVSSLFASGSPGAYGLQAAIAAAHATARSAAETNWQQIASLYDALLVVHPSPVIELNRAVAIAMRDGPEVGLNAMAVIQVNIPRLPKGDPENIDRLLAEIARH